MNQPWPVDVRSLGVAACGARLWRGPAGRHLTVVVKAHIALTPGAQAALLPGVEIVTKDRHYQSSPGRSVEEAGEVAPYLARCDVTLRGHAFAPPGQPARAMTVRLAVYRGAPLLDKKLFVYGDRDEAAPDQRAPFQRMPLDYEHAFGGRSHAANPVGRGAEAKGSGALPPSVVDPADPQRPAGFAPLSRFWADRARLLGSAARKLVDGDEPELGQGFDFRYFQSAPADQQVPYLAGDEWIVLDGVHPTLARVQTALPSLRAAAAVYAFTGAAFEPAKALDLHADMLSIDADRLTASIVWRGSMLLEPGMDVARLKVVGGVEAAGAPIVWPDPRTFEPPHRVEAPRAATSALDGAETRVQTAEEAASAGRAQISPFTPGARPFLPPPSAPRAAAPDHGATVSVDPSKMEAKALPFAIAPPAPDHGATVSVDPSKMEAKALPFAIAPPAPPPPPVPPLSQATPDFSGTVVFSVGAIAASPLPFSEAGPESFLPPPEIHDAAFTGTVTLTPEALERSNKQVLPFVLAREDRARQAPAESAERPRDVPLRTSPQLPIVNVTKFAAATTPWQVRPPQDSLTVIVKATCDLVPDGPAALRDEPDLPTGDIHVDDDLDKSLVYPSDFAIMKPRADVLLTGHAVARAPVTHARVTLKIGGGSGPRGFERSIAVIGDRAWKRGLAGASPGEPAPFERMPLVYERAFGGPTYGLNPSGTGQEATPLPNLEDPAHPVTSATDAPPPACFGPVSPLWRVRTGKLGTFGPEWLASRWPYFPGDFDWSFFQAAPKAQQIAYLRGDEPFEITGVHADHPVLRGSLPGVRARAFALQTKAEGGGLFEIPLRLDTVVFDVDAMKVNLVWRGLFEANDDEATELTTLFVHAEDLAAAPLPLDEVARLLVEAATPREPIEEEEPDSELEVPPLAPVELREEVVARLAEGASFDGADLAGANLAGLDFTDRSLAGANLKGASLQGSQMRGADLCGALLARADLEGCDLRGASLAGADLTFARLEGALLDGADLEDADLSGAEADRASFTEARGAGAQLAGGSFRAARFDRADLAGADLTEAVLDGASFADATLTEVRLYFAKGQGVCFDRARLDDARGDDAILIGCGFAGASAPSSIWEKATLSGSSFAKATLTGASFARAACDGVLFHAVGAARARFARANLARAEFLGANLMEADFELADLSNADLRGANLHGAETRKAKLAGAKLDLAIVTRSKLKRRG